MRPKHATTTAFRRSPSSREEGSTKDVALKKRTSSPFSASFDSSPDEPLATLSDRQNELCVLLATKRVQLQGPSTEPNFYFLRLVVLLAGTFDAVVFPPVRPVVPPAFALAFFGFDGASASSSLSRTTTSVVDLRLAPRPLVAADEAVATGGAGACRPVDSPLPGAGRLRVLALTPAA